jgi:hypothetical protein
LRIHILSFLLHNKDRGIFRAGQTFWDLF